MSAALEKHRQECERLSNEIERYLRMKDEGVVGFGPPPFVRDDRTKDIIQAYVIGIVVGFSVLAAALYFGG